MAGESEDDIPLADDDSQEGEPESSASSLTNGQSFESIQSACSPQHHSPDEQEKARLISQVLELQNTLDDLSQRLDNVKEENLRLKSENLVLVQYIENIMSASSVFSTTPKVKKK